MFIYCNCNRNLKATKENITLSETLRESKRLVSNCWGYGGLCTPDQRQRGGEKRDLQHSKDRTNQCRNKVGNLFIDIHQTQHSDMADTGKFRQLIDGPDSSVTEPGSVL